MIIFGVHLVLHFNLSLLLVKTDTDTIVFGIYLLQELLLEYLTSDWVVHIDLGSLLTIMFTILILCVEVYIAAQPIQLVQDRKLL